MATGTNSNHVEAPSELERSPVPIQAKPNSKRGLAVGSVRDARVVERGKVEDLYWLLPIVNEAHYEVPMSTAVSGERRRGCYMPWLEWIRGSWCSPVADE